MSLFEESIGLVEHIARLRNAFVVEEKPSLQLSLVRSALEEILSDKELLKRILERLAHDIHFVREQAGNVFNNEVILWRDPNLGFSLRMQIWAEGADNIIHDHNGFGVLGCWLGRVWVENYQVVEKTGDKVKIQLKEKIELTPGKTALIKAGEEGIHRVSWEPGEMAVTLGAYSRVDSGRNYILGYELESGKTFKIYHPSRIQRLWAKRLLAFLEQD